MIEIYENDSDDLVGVITEAQLDFLMEELEESSESDREFNIDTSTLLLLEELGADEELLEVLQNALGDGEAAEIRWEEAEERLDPLEEEESEPIPVDDVL